MTDNRNDRDPFEFRGTYFERPEAWDGTMSLIADGNRVRLQLLTEDGLAVMNLTLLELAMIGSVYPEQVRFMVQPPADEEAEEPPPRRVFRLMVEDLGTVE